MTFELTMSLSLCKCAYCVAFSSCLKTL